MLTERWPRCRANARDVRDLSSVADILVCDAVRPMTDEKITLKLSTVQFTDRTISAALCTSESACSLCCCSGSRGWHIPAPSLSIRRGREGARSVYVAGRTAGSGGGRGRPRRRGVGGRR